MANSIENEADDYIRTLLGALENLRDVRNTHLVSDCKDLIENNRELARQSVLSHLYANTTAPPAVPLGEFVVGGEINPNQLALIVDLVKSLNLPVVESSTKIVDPTATIDNAVDQAIEANSIRDENIYRQNETLVNELIKTGHTIEEIKKVLDFSGMEGAKNVEEIVETLSEIRKTNIEKITDAFAKQETKKWETILGGFFNTEYSNIWDLLSTIYERYMNEIDKNMDKHTQDINAMSIQPLLSKYINYLFYALGDMFYSENLINIPKGKALNDDQAVGLFVFGDRINDLPNNVQKQNELHLSRLLLEKVDELVNNKILVRKGKAKKPPSQGSILTESEGQGSGGEQKKTKKKTAKFVNPIESEEEKELTPGGKKGGEYVPTQKLKQVHIKTHSVLFPSRSRSPSPSRIPSPTSAVNVKLGKASLQMQSINKRNLQEAVASFFKDPKSLNNKVKYNSQIFSPFDDPVEAFRNPKGVKSDIYKNQPEVLEANIKAYENLISDQNIKQSIDDMGFWLSEYIKNQPAQNINNISNPLEFLNFLLNSLLKSKGVTIKKVDENTASYLKERRLDPVKLTDQIYSLCGSIPIDGKWSIQPIINEAAASMFFEPLSKEEQKKGEEYNAYYALDEGGNLIGILTLVSTVNALKAESEENEYKFGLNRNLPAGYKNLGKYEQFFNILNKQRRPFDKAIEIQFLCTGSQSYINLKGKQEPVLVYENVKSGKFYDPNKFIVSTNGKEMKVAADKIMRKEKFNKLGILLIIHALLDKGYKVNQKRVITQNYNALTVEIPYIPINAGPAFDVKYKQAYEDSTSLEAGPDSNAARFYSLYFNAIRAFGKYKFLTVVPAKTLFCDDCNPYVLKLASVEKESKGKKKVIETETDIYNRMISEFPRLDALFIYICVHSKAFLNLSK